MPYALCPSFACRDILEIPLVKTSTHFAIGPEKHISTSGGGITVIVAEGQGVLCRQGDPVLIEIGAWIIEGDVTRMWR